MGEYECTYPRGLGILGEGQPPRLEDQSSSIQASHFHQTS